MHYLGRQFSPNPKGEVITDGRGECNLPRGSWRYFFDLSTCPIL